MNQYYLLRRLRGPVILVTIGVMALLDQYDVLSFGRSWPVILIVFGVLMLAERMVLAQMPPPPPGGYAPEYYGMPAQPQAPAQPAAGQSGDSTAQTQQERKF